MNIDRTNVSGAYVSWGVVGEKERRRGRKKRKMHRQDGRRRRSALGSAGVTAGAAVSVDTVGHLGLTRGKPPRGILGRSI